jgi:hypothetical protein
VVGIQTARSASKVHANEPITNTNGSQVLTPNRKLAMKRASPKDAPMPIANANDGEPHAVPDDEFADGGAVAAGRSRATRVSSHQRDVHRWTILFDFGHIRI